MPLATPNPRARTPRGNGVTASTPGPLVDLTTTTSFTKKALVDLPRASEFLASLREEALAE